MSGQNIKTILENTEGKECKTGQVLGGMRSGGGGGGMEEMEKLSRVESKSTSESFTSELAGTRAMKGDTERKRTDTSLPNVHP